MPQETRARRAERAGKSSGDLAGSVRTAAEPFDAIAEAGLEPLLRRIGGARVVLLGEATHGTSEFYRMRSRLTRELVARKGFDVVAVEADWPDARRVDDYLHDRRPAGDWKAFSRFPTWMWRNEEVRELVERLRDFQRARSESERSVGFYGLDLYSLYSSIAAVLEYLDERDPRAAATARERYACLTPWEKNPAAYGRAVLTRGLEACEDEAVSILENLLDRRMELEGRDGEGFLDAVQNARLVANAERYYRSMYYGGAASWNLRDRHMFDTLRLLLAHRGPDARAVVWAHNSHLGDASATEMASRGELNLGQLCRQEWGPDAYLVGFGTHAGTVAAASDWEAPMQVMDVRPSHPESYERVCHDSGLSRFLLPLRVPPSSELRERLSGPRLERAIGVVYRPRTELASHYFQAVLPRQFDEWIWFDRTEAVTPLDTEEMRAVPETYPFGL